MRDDDEETQRLRSVALQNAQEVVAARRRLEEQLLQAHEELREQARVLELLNKTGAVLASNLKHDVVIVIANAVSFCCLSGILWFKLREKLDPA